VERWKKFNKKLAANRKELKMNDYMIDGKLDPGGFETDKRAKQYMRENPGTDYTLAVKTVLRESRDALDAKKDRAIKRANYEQDGKGPLTWRIYADADGNIAEMEMDGTGMNINRLSNIVVGLPRLPDHSIDAAVCTQVINANFGDIGRGAAGDFLYAAAMKIRQEIERKGPGPWAATTDPHGSMMAVLLKEAGAKYPEVAAVYNGGRMTQEALRSILWPLFKTPVPQYQSRGGQPQLQQREGSYSIRCSRSRDSHL
jgi:hypothetical protein